MAAVGKRAVSRRRRNDGYCYVQLFRDVLGDKLSVKETKRIFGRYPLLKDVLVQLVRLTKYDVYVHDIVPTGFSTYHVVDSEVTLLSSLVIRHMFSDALIGGYDAAEDLALQRSDYARRLASMAQLGRQAPQEILQNAAAVVLRKELSQPDSIMAQFVQDVASETTRGRKIFLPYRLHPLDLTRMQADYPEYTLINANNRAHPHAIAGNSRVVDMEVMLDLVNYRKNASPLYGEDVYLVDIGGDYVSHVKNGRMNVHSDSPILTARDSAREMTRRLTLGALVKSRKMSERTYNNLVGATAPCKQRCTDKAQDCTVTGTFAILLHSDYDIKREELAQAFDNHQTKVAVSAVHFDPRVFTQKSFLVEALKARVSIEGEKIHFDFAGDTSLSYTHDYANYMDIVTTNMLITPAGRCYLVEKAGIRGATLFIKYVLCDVAPQCDTERLRCCFWLPEQDDRLVISTWKYQNGYYQNSKFVRTGENDQNGRFLRHHIEVSKGLYDLILANCLRASEKGFNLSEMLSAAIAFNQRCTINGQDVRHNRDRLDVELLIDVTVACYCQAYVLRFGAGKVVEYFTNQERAKRSGRFGFLSLLGYCAQQLVPTNTFKERWNSFMAYLSEGKEVKDMTFEISNSVRVVTMEEHVRILAGYEHHVGEARLTVDGGEIDLLDIRNVLELKYEKGKLVGVPRSDAATDVARAAATRGSPTVVSVAPATSCTPSTTTSSVISGATLQRGDLSKRKLKQVTNKAVRALSRISDDQPLSESRLAALRDLRSESKSTCGSLHMVRMVGDGRCAFYAMLHCIGLPPSVECVSQLKRVLWSSCPDDCKNDNRNLLLDDFEDSDLAWGTTDNFGLFSSLVESVLCVHVINNDSEMKTEAYSKVAGADHAMHVRWDVRGAGHVDMYEGPTFAEDTKMRAANFVRNVQRLLFSLNCGRVPYEETSRLPEHPYINRSGLKFLSLLASYPGLQTAGRVLDLCGAPGGFLCVLQRLNADAESVSGPAIDYDERVDGSVVRRLDIVAQDVSEGFPRGAYDLVLADGGDDTSYLDATLLSAQIDVILRVLRSGGNCVLKVSNFFTQLSVTDSFVRNFERVVIEKPDFSALGNTEIYMVCFGYGRDHVEVVGEEKTRHALLKGLLGYVECALTGLDKSDKKKTELLLKVLEANVFGPAGEKVWRPRGLTGGGPARALTVSSGDEQLLNAIDAGRLVLEGDSDCADKTPTASCSGCAASSDVDARFAVDDVAGAQACGEDVGDGVETSLYSDETERAVEEYIDNAVLCEVPVEGKLTWRERVGRVFGKQPKLCKNAAKTQKAHFSLISTKTITSGGVLSDGKSINQRKKTKVVYEKKIQHVATTSMVCRDVGVGAGVVYLSSDPKEYKILPRQVSVTTCNRGTCVDFDGDEQSILGDEETVFLDDNSVVDSGFSTDDADSQASTDMTASVSGEGIARAPTMAGRPVAEPDRASVDALGVNKEGGLAAFIHNIDPVNVPANEPVRATATYFAVDKIQQDFLVSYAWPTGRKQYKISKCLKELVGQSTFDVDVLNSMPRLAVLECRVPVLQTVVSGVRVCLLVLGHIDALDEALMQFLDAVAECCQGKLRISLDVLVCKDYDLDSLGVMQFSNRNKNLLFVLYLHNQFSKGRAFGSPYLYPGSARQELFPKLTDEDLGLVRRPTLLDDSIMENRYKNAMIEYLHTSTFSQNVLAVKLREVFVQVVGTGLPSVQALARWEKKGYYFYDNQAGAVMSGAARPSEWAFVLHGGGWRFARFNKEMKRYAGTERFFLFTRETKVLLTEDIADNLRGIDIMEVKMPKVTWINGPPGCGKTEYALRTHTKPSCEPDRKTGDMILTVTKEGTLSLRERMTGVVDSKYLTRNYRTVASVLMNGAGGREFERVIVDEALMVHAGALCYAAHILGAKELILIGDVHQIPFIDRDHVSLIQYAGPERFCSVSRTLICTRRCPIDVTYLLSEKYDGFYSVSDKAVSMKRERVSGRGIPKERGVVYLVLFQSDKEDLIRQGYAQEAKVLTVHESQGQTFKHVRYVRFSPKALKLYESEGHAIVALSRHTDSFVYYTDVDDMVVTWMQRVAGRSEVELRRWNDERRVRNGESLKAGFYAPPVIDFKPSTNTYAGPEAKRAMAVIGGVPHRPNVPGVLSQARVAYSLPVTELRCPKDTDIGYVQTWYDSVIPTSVEVDVTHDQLICESSDLQIAIHDQLVIDPLKVGYKDKSYDRLKPRLRTLMPKNVVQSQIQTLLCLSKRNANAPVLRNEQLSPAVAATYLFKNFTKSCLRDDFDIDTAFDTINPNEVLLQQWLDKQPPGVKKMIQSDVPVAERTFDTYSFMVKDKLKPPLEPSAAYKIPSGQTIAYHSKDVNAYVCPIFSIARDRLLSILKDNIMIMTGMSTEDFEASINDRFNIDDLWGTTNRIENDFSKYDKSQHETLLRFEIMLYEMLGVPRDLLDVWYESHRRSTLKDKSNGVRMKTEFQRKSGDAVTFLGNTVCLLAVTAACYDFSSVRLGLFAGDDSLLFVDKHVPGYDATAALADWFNLESKLLDVYDYSYFCSKFFLPYEGRLYIVPDILKTLTKWGRSDLVNREHVEEYRVSLADSLKPLKNVLLHSSINNAVCERYHSQLDAAKTVRVMITYVSDPELFQSLFTVEDERKLMVGPSRPSLD